MSRKRKQSSVVLNPINFVTGTLGAGKSGYAVRTAFRYLAAGKHVALNFDLIPYRTKGGTSGYDGTPWYVTAYNLAHGSGSLGGLLAPSHDPEERWRWITGAMSRCLRYEDQSDLFDYRLPGDPEQEDRGLLVMDEGALRANSRLWNERTSTNKKKYGHALKDLEFMLHIRKLGWTMLLLTQGYKMIDNQYRELGPVEIRLRNLSKITIPGIGVPFSSKPRFIAIHWMAEAKMITRREYYGVSRAFGHYHSNALFDPLAVMEGGVRLMTPIPSGSWPPTYDEWATPAGGVAAPGEVRAGAASPSPVVSSSAGIGGGNGAI